MKIFNADDFIAERVKLEPITNVELENAQKRWELEKSKPVQIPLSSIKSIDDLQPGWFVVTNDHYVRIVLPLEYAVHIFNISTSNKNKYFLVKVRHNIAGYIEGKSYKNTFPHYEFDDDTFDIIKIFKYTVPDLEDKCKYRQRFEPWYTENVWKLFKDDPDYLTYKFDQK